MYQLVKVKLVPANNEQETSETFHGFIIKSSITVFVSDSITKLQRKKAEIYEADIDKQFYYYISDHTVEAI